MSHTDSSSLAITATEVQPRSKQGVYPEPFASQMAGRGRGGWWIFTHKNGERHSAAKAYLTPHLSRPNLRVITGAHATRILFEGPRAVGVEYRQGGTLQQVRAARELLLSAGALLSPQLLMLSGVGDQAALTSHGIAPVHHLPGVGANLQDHPDFVFTYTSDNPNFTAMSFAGIARLLRGIGQYRRERLFTYRSERMAGPGGAAPVSPAHTDTPGLEAGGSGLAHCAQPDHVCPGQNNGGRYWDRTSDLFRVKEARSRCANRPHNALRGGDGI